MICIKFYFFGGCIDVIMKVVFGKGIVSFMMWFSDNFDEVDWEFIGVNDIYVFINYFGKGVEDFCYVGWYVILDFQNDYYNYSIVWLKDKFEWYIDGDLV